VSVQVQETTPRRGRPGPAPVVAGSARKPAAPRSRALDLIGIVALLALLGVVLPVLVADRYGALGIPRSDDWSYLLTLFRWVDSGKLTFNGWVSMTLVGQVVIAAPLVAIGGRSITTIQLFTSMLGLVGLLGVVFIGRQMVRPPWWAVFVAATIAAGPLWGPLAPTFMTDVPTFTFEMLTLAAAAVAFRRRPVSVPWFAVSLAFGFVGVAIRQYAVIPVIAIVIVAVVLLALEKEWRKLTPVLVLSAIFAVAALGILYWWSGLPDSKSLSPTLPTGHTISAVFIKDAGFLRLAGLLLLPVVVLAGPIAILRRAWAASRNLTALATTVMVVWLVAMYIRVPKTPFVGNYIARDGVLSEVVLAGNRPDVIPPALFDLLVVLGSVAGMLIVLAAVPFVVDLPRRLRERDFTIESPLVAVMGLTVVGFVVAYSIATLTGLPLYDRYGLPVLPLLAFLVLRTAQREPLERRTARPKVAWAGVAIVCLALLGFAYTVDSASFDGTRWEVAQAATRQGYTPTQVGGGFEWLGYHREHGPQYRWEGAAKNTAMLGFAPPCITVVINPPNVNGKKVVASATSSAISREDVVIVARRNGRPCSTGRGAPGDESDKPIAHATNP
jgi:hypothetical protein